MIKSGTMQRCLNRKSKERVKENKRNSNTERLRRSFQQNAIENGNIKGKQKHFSMSQFLQKVNPLHVLNP